MLEAEADHVAVGEEAALVKDGRVGEVEVGAGHVDGRGVGVGET